MSKRPTGPSSASAHRAELKLLAVPPRPARAAYVPPRRLPRRPGERREPLALTNLPTAFAVAATASQLELGCAAELCLEHALVVRDLSELGRSDLYPPLLELAGSARVRPGLPTAKARYLQMLLAARERSGFMPDSERGGNDTVVDVPLRLFPRVLDVVNEGFDAQQLDEAIRLEVAAVADGRTMSEWAALSALRLSR
jgi:hypothetical protein